jgi:hypothetical protein
VSTNEPATTENQEVVQQASKLTDQEKNFQEKIKSLRKTVNKNDRETLCSYIELGKELLKIKLELKDRFYFAITDEILPKKQVQRYLKIVLITDEKNNSLSKLMKDTEKMRTQEDTKVTSLTPDTIHENCEVLSLSKLSIAKELKEDKFNVLMKEGDNSIIESHIESKNKKLKATKDADKEEHFKEVSDVIEKSSYDIYCDDTEAAINAIAEQKRYSDDLEKELEDLKQKAELLTKELTDLANSTEALHKAGVINNSLVNMAELQGSLYIPNKEINI